MYTSVLRQFWVLTVNDVWSARQLRLGIGTYCISALPEQQRRGEKMVSKMSFGRSAVVALVTLLVLGVAGSSQAAPRMYTASLIIVSFGNDTSTGSTAPFDAVIGLGIPLVGNCDEKLFHAGKRSRSRPIQSALRRRIRSCSRFRNTVVR